MTSLGRVVRTTAFKLSAIYFAVFSIFAVAFVLYISYSTNALLTQQLEDTIREEIRGLADQGRSGGLMAIVDAIDQRSRQPGASLYLITDVSGRILSGNVSDVPSSLLEQPGMGPITVPYRRTSEDSTRDQLALVQVLRLPGGFRMLVGRDLGERREFSEIIARSLAWAVALMIGLALISWFFVSRRVLKRIDSVSATSRRIMSGDLTGRLEVTGTGDEFDRLADSLNAMLERIEALLHGLKDVSDNIAHDLKTPLTRLRNRVEAALAGPEDGGRYREALESTIEESDRLIQTFNALLMIARIEAGSPDGAMSEVEAGEIVRDVAELYEPVAEEQGAAIEVDIPAPVTLKASRELLGQAVANLIDNALKYAHPEGGGMPTLIRIGVRAGDGDLVLSVADNGEGIPAAERDRVLQRFVRLEKSRSRPGSGLGLSLVAAVARLHHGTIELGDANPGLVVTVKLPLKGG
ncbi:MAG: HAMP domain-containing protein [Rhizobiales bacterium]|nr:HAMP domain-containing protein [Hyphomicrobiales bacterium]